MMKFNGVYNVDLRSWRQVRMRRDEGEQFFAAHRTERPKFGAGSAFGKEEREHARRRRRKSHLVEEDRPWLLEADGKKFKGTKEGGVSDNTTYYLFTRNDKDTGSVEAFPIASWFNFRPVQRFKALDAEEAEEKFAQRGRKLNMWSAMVEDRLKHQEEDAEDEEEEKNKGKKKKREIFSMSERKGNGVQMDTGDADTEDRDEERSDLDAYEKDYESDNVGYMSTEDSSDSEISPQQETDAKNFIFSENSAKNVRNSSSSEDEKNETLADTYVTGVTESENRLSAGSPKMQIPFIRNSRNDRFRSSLSASSDRGSEAITKETVIRYIKRKPMTTVDLLKKIKASKKVDLENNQLVLHLACILKKIHPRTETVRGVTYLSL